MSRYLAAILGFCALTTAPLTAAVSPAPTLQLFQETPAPASPPQDSPQNSAPAPTGAEPQAGAQPETKPPESSAPPAKARTTSKKRRHRKTGSSSSTPDKKVVRNGGTADPVVQLTPGMSKEQASSQRQNTSQLLAATDNNLKQISARSLNSSQQDSVSQIRKYMEQANEAEQAGDVERAHNLASKALLLSDDLVKH